MGPNALSWRNKNGAINGSFRMGKSDGSSVLVGERLCRKAGLREEKARHIDRRSDKGADYERKGHLSKSGAKKGVSSK